MIAHLSKVGNFPGLHDHYRIATVQEVNVVGDKDLCGGGAKRCARDCLVEQVLANVAVYRRQGIVHQQKLNVGAVQCTR